MSEFPQTLLEADTQFYLDYIEGFIEGSADVVIYNGSDPSVSIDNNAITQIIVHLISIPGMSTSSYYILDIQVEEGIDLRDYIRDLNNRDKIIVFEKRSTNSFKVFLFADLQQTAVTIQAARDEEFSISGTFSTITATDEEPDPPHNCIRLSFDPSSSDRLYFQLNDEFENRVTRLVFPSNERLNILVGRGLISASKYNIVFAVPSYIQDVYGMINTDILGLLILAEQFALIDLKPNIDDDNQNLFEIDVLSPVYKTIEDVYVGTDSFKYIEEATSFFNDGNPVFRTYFDLTSPLVRGRETQDIGRYIWPLEVQIRIQFVEPTADIIQKIGGRKYLRGGNLQFIISTDRDVNINAEDEIDDRGRPITDLFRVAQFYINKYGSKRAEDILRDIPVSGYLLQNGFEEELPEYSIFRYTGAFRSRVENSTRHHINRIDVTKLLSKIFPGFNFEQSANFLSILLAQGTNVRSIYSFTTGTAIAANLRFAPIERRTVTDPRIFNPTYGLAVTIPFTFEQIR